MPNDADVTSVQIYTFAKEMADRGNKHMGKKNIVLTKDGMSVGVKHVRDEDYEDKTQRCASRI